MAAVGRRASVRRQHGIAAIALMAVIVLGLLAGLTLRMNSIERHDRAARARVTQEAVRLAKQALIAFAVANVARPGGLPCPDLNDDGEAERSCDAPNQRVGRLPWQTIRSGDLRDASGERLWYVVSRSHRNDVDAVINNRTIGELRVAERSREAPEPAIAIVVAPGSALANQMRIGPHRLIPRNYLEAALPAVGSVTQLDATSARSSNDVIVALGRAELMEAVEPAVRARLREEIVPLMRNAYFAAWQALAYPSSGTPNGRSGDYPAVTAADLVRWDAASVAIEQTAGTGRVDSAACETIDGARKIRCDLRYSGDVRIRLSAVARQVGRTWASVPPPSALSATAPLDDVQIRAVGLNAEGHATLQAWARLPLATSVRLMLAAPVDVIALTPSIHIPADVPAAWFARNEWYKSLQYELSPADQPGRADSAIAPNDIPLSRLRLKRWYEWTGRSNAPTATSQRALVTFICTHRCS